MEEKKKIIKEEWAIPDSVEAVNEIKNSEIVEEIEDVEETDGTEEK